MKLIAAWHPVVAQEWTTLQHRILHLVFGGRLLRIQRQRKSWKKEQTVDNVGNGTNVTYIPGLEDPIPHSGGTGQRLEDRSGHPHHQQG